jgi:hypothetical protein
VPTENRAGIAHNKLLAKLASGMNKPDKQTVIPLRSVTALMRDMPMAKVRNFGGKLGATLAALGCKTAADVQSLDYAQLEQAVGDQAACDASACIAASCHLLATCPRPDALRATCARHKSAYIQCWNHRTSLVQVCDARMPWHQ